jgi:hypothetical protein
MCVSALYRGSTCQLGQLGMTRPMTHKQRHTACGAREREPSPYRYPLRPDGCSVLVPCALCTETDPHTRRHDCRRGAVSPRAPLPIAGEMRLVCVRQPGWVVKCGDAVASEPWLACSDRRLHYGGPRCRTSVVCVRGCTAISLEWSQCGGTGSDRIGCR